MDKSTKTNNLEKENSEGDILDLLAEGYTCSWKKELSNLISENGFKLNQWLYYAKGLHKGDLLFLEEYKVLSEKEIRNYSKLEKKLRIELKPYVNKSLWRNKYYFKQIELKRKKRISKELIVNLEFQKSFYEEILRYYAGLENRDLITQNKTVIDEMKNQKEIFKPLIEKIKNNYLKIILTESPSWVKCGEIKTPKSSRLFKKWCSVNEIKFSAKESDFIYSIVNDKLVLNKFDKEKAKKIKSEIVKELKDYGKFVEKQKWNSCPYRELDSKFFREKVINGLDQVTEIGDIETLNNIKYAYTVAIKAYHSGISLYSNNRNKKYYEDVARHFQGRAWVNAAYNNFNCAHVVSKKQGLDGRVERYENIRDSAIKKMTNLTFDIIYNKGDIDKATNNLVKKGLLNSAEKLSDDLRNYFKHRNNNQLEEVFSKRKEIYKRCYWNNCDFDA